MGSEDEFVPRKQGLNSRFIKKTPLLLILLRLALVVVLAENSVRRSLNRQPRAVVHLVGIECDSDGSS